MKSLSITLIIVIVSSLILTSSCDSSKNKPTINQIQKTEEECEVRIYGKIDSLEKDYFDFHEISISDLFNYDQREITIQMDSLGNFFTQFHVDHKQDILLGLGPFWDYIFVEPGDSIFINVLSNDSIVFSGDNATLNNQFNFVRKNGLSSIFENSPVMESPEEHFWACDSSKNSRLNFIDMLDNGLDLDSDLKKWLENHVIFRNIYELLLHPEGIQVYDSLSTLKFKDYISQISYEDLIYSDWKHGFYDRIVLHGRNYISPGDGYVDSLFKFCTGITSEECLLNDLLTMNLFLALRENTTLNEFERFKHYLYEEIKNDSIRANLLQQYDEFFKKNGLYDIESLNIVEGEINTENFLQSIIERSPNKVIYIDFWATYCAPCLKELEIANNHTEPYKEKVQFIYVCMGTNQDVWRDQISRFGIEGDLYYIEKDDARKIKEDLSINGYPTYFIISKSGEIIRKDYNYRLSGTLLSPFLDSLIKQ